jgi:hypothetical protein
MSSPIRTAAGLLLVALAAFWVIPAQAAQLVRVGAAHFPPYTVRPESGADTGLLPQLVEALNALQATISSSWYRPRFLGVSVISSRAGSTWRSSRTPTGAGRRFLTPDVDMGLEDAEIFVAQREDGRQQNYFADLKGKRLALFSGYHYEFANFNADPKYLADTFNATLTYSHDSNLLMVLRGRADIALVTRSYLFDYLLRNEKCVTIAGVATHRSGLPPLRHSASDGTDHWRGVRQVAAGFARQWPDAEDLRSLQDCRGAGGSSLTDFHPGG